MLATVLCSVPLAACGSVRPAAARPGERAPRPPAGYRTVYRSNFSTGRLGSGWYPYSGQPGSDRAGWWYPSHVGVRRGMLVLRTYKDPAHYGHRSGTPWVEGGVDLHLPHPQTYGEWLVRARATATAGVTEVMILWPRNNGWPPEIDFAESDGRNAATATLHWGNARQDYKAQANLPPVNLERWHTFGVIVTESQIRYLLDGRAWETMPNHEHSPMDLAIQQQVWPCGSQYESCPGPTTPRETDLEVAWVAEYARAG